MIKRMIVIVLVLVVLGGGGYYAYTRITAAKASTTTDNIAETGSSMAAPFVAGVCALMLEANDELSPTELKEILRDTAVDFGPPGEDVDYGAGRLDAYAAIREAETPARQP